MSEFPLPSILSLASAQPGWFAFFHDPDTPGEPFCGEPIVALGILQGQNGDYTYGQGLRVDETGLLDNEFSYAWNFLGVYYHRGLIDHGADIVAYPEISLFPNLVHRLQTRQDEKNREGEDCQAEGRDDDSEDLLPDD